MSFNFWSSVRLVIACLMVSLFALAPQSMFAQTHVVSPTDLQQATVAATQSRQANMARLNDVLSSPVGQKALQEAHADATQVKTAISNLSDQDLAKLAARADKAQKDFAAGSISDHLLLLIVIAIVIVIIIIIAVKV
ncbi:MAG TPA: PA2779 family protein [Terriglobales bacterium]